MLNTNEEKILFQAIKIYSEGIVEESLNLNSYNYNIKDLEYLLYKSKMCGIFYRLFQRNKLLFVSDDMLKFVFEQYQLQCQRNKEIIDEYVTFSNYLDRQNYNHIIAGNIVIQNNICGIGHIDVTDSYIIIPKKYSIKDNLNFKNVIIKENIEFINNSILFNIMKSSTDKYITPKLMFKDYSLKIKASIDKKDDYNIYNYILFVFLLYNAYLKNDKEKNEFLSILSNFKFFNHQDLFLTNSK